ncbi:hypothetical protein I4U23_005068 [Adineta vaga]|nr:hypothetical protein I4U23_005068 [Adineta vaga]
MASETRDPSDRRRFFDVSEEPKKPLLPLHIPISKSNQEQLGLMECVKPIEKAKLVPYLLDQVTQSLCSCQYPKDGLTRDESAALYLYSLPGEFYTTFNGVLRSEDCTKSIPFHDYYKLFMSALKKLPSIQGIVWRGVTADVSVEYSPGSIHVWHAASSCTDQIHVTDTFLDKTKQRTLFSIQCFYGKAIKNHSRFPKESETILPPGTFIRVKGRSNPAENLFIVTCEETTPTPEEMKVFSARVASVALPGSVPGLAPKVFLVWLHPSMDKTTDNIKTQEKLRQLFPDNFQTFKSSEECEWFIKQKSNDRIIFIVGGQIGQQFVPNVHDLTQLVIIIVYCMDKEGNEKWAKHFTKIKAVLIKLKELISEVKQLKEQEEAFITNQDKLPTTTRIPISGFEKAPLLCLEEALKPITELIPDLDGHIYVAKRNTRDIFNHELTPDESASIYIYTMDMQEISLYQVLNQTLRSEKRDDIKPWFLYLKLFMTALIKLPSHQGVVWRAVPGNIAHAYQRGVRGVWWGVTSATTNGRCVEHFMSQSQERVIFTIECKNGKDIRKYDCFHDEEQVLLMPGFCYEVTTVMRSADKMHIIGLKEVDPSW